jgi:KaiC/GvpD/RAD55 family RecA-like ATPase
MTRDHKTELLLAGLLHDKILFIEVASRFNGKVFELEDYNRFFEYLKLFYKQFKKNPTRAEFEIFVDRRVLSEFVFLDDVFYNPEISSDVLRKKLYDNYQKMQTLEFVEELEQKIDTGKMDIQETFSGMKQVVLKTSQPDTSYLEINVDNAVKLYENARDYRMDSTSPFIFKQISRIAGGGIANRELGIFIAPPNRGKTNYLINELYNGLVLREKVLMLSMENEPDSINSRLSNRILLMSKHEQRINQDFCKAWIEKFYHWVTVPTIMYRAPNTFTVSEFDLWLEEYELKHGIRFDRIIVDYMNKFKKGKTAEKVNDWDAVRFMTDELRAIAIARNTKIITAGQTNRGGLYDKEGSENSEVNESHIAGGFGQFETADIVLAFSETQNEKQRGVGRVSILKMREAGGRGRGFVVNVCPWIGLITDSPDDILPLDKRKLLENPDTAFGELKGLETKPPDANRKKAKSMFPQTGAQ